MDRACQVRGRCVSRLTQSRGDPEGRCDTRGVQGADGTAPLYGMLGPLRLSGEGGVVRIKSRLQRLLLTVLLVDANRTVSTDRLAD